MWPLFIIGAMLSIFAVTSGYTNSIDRENSPENRGTAQTVARFRVFAFAAETYVKKHPTASGSIYWATIKAAPEVPPSAKGANIATNWKIVADGAGAFVICAELPEAVTAALIQTMPVTRRLRPVAGTSKVVFAETDLEATTEAAKCN